MCRVCRFLCMKRLPLFGVGGAATLLPCPLRPRWWEIWPGECMFYVIDPGASSCRERAVLNDVLLLFVPMQS